MKPKDILIAGAALGGLAIASQLAFTRDKRYEMFQRDRGVCQHHNCFWDAVFGTNASWVDGFHMQAAHWADSHQKGWDRNIRNGRMLCTTDHIFEEIERGNHWGAEQLWRNQTIRRYEFIDKDDWKMPLAWYYDWVETDDHGRQGLMEAYLDRFDFAPGYQPSLFCYNE